MTTELSPFVLPLPMSLVVQPIVALSAAAVSGDPAVLVTAGPHYFVTGDLVTITGTPYAGTYPVTVVDDTTFTIPIPASGAPSLGSTVQRTTPVEPLTVADGKLLAGLDWLDGDPRDEQMRGYIAAARAQVEADSGWALLTQVRDVYTATSSTSMLPPSQTFPLQATLGTRPGATSDITITRIVSGCPSIAELPPSATFAIGLLTAHYATLGRDLAIVERPTSVPMGYAEAIAAFALVTQI